MDSPRSNNDDDGRGIPIDAVLRLWADTVGDHPDRHVTYFAIHRADFDEKDTFDWLLNPVVAVSMATNAETLVPVLLMPWHLTEEIQSSVLVVNDPGADLYITEIRADGSYHTERVEWSIDRNVPHVCPEPDCPGTTDEFNFSEPEPDIHLQSWEWMETLAGLGRSNGFDFRAAIGTAAAMLETMSKGGIN